MARPNRAALGVDVYFLLRFYDEDWNPLVSLSVLSRSVNVIASKLQRWKLDREQSLGMNPADLVGHARAFAASLELSDGSERQDES